MPVLLKIDGSNYLVIKLAQGGEIMSPNIEKSERSIIKPKSNRVQNLGKSEKKTRGRVKSLGTELTFEKTRIAFLFDASSSRRGSWKEAQVWQEEIINEFANAGAEVRIVVHRGGKIKDLGWYVNGHDAKSSMAETTCEVGYTQISQGLRACTKGTDDKPPKAIIMVGDDYETEDVHPKKVAHELKKKNIPVHAFFEGDEEKGKEVYKAVADITGGAFIKLGPDMNLKELMKVVFVYNIEGLPGLKRLPKNSPEVKALKEAGLLKLNAPPSEGNK